MMNTRHSLSWLAGSVALAIAMHTGAQSTSPANPSGTPSTTAGPATPAPPTGSNAPSAAGTNAPGNTGSSMSKSTGASSLSSSDRNFIMKAAQGGMAEVELGQLASQRASDPQVKQFAERMVADHGKANDQLKQIASSKNVTLPTDVPAAEKRERDRLAKLSGAQFDREYMSHMVSDHQKDIKEFQKAAKSAKDPDVKSFAESTLPTLNDHLAAAKSAQAAAKNGAKTGARTTSKQAG